MHSFRFAQRSLFPMFTPDFHAIGSNYLPAFRPLISDFCFPQEAPSQSRPCTHVVCSPYLHIVQLALSLWAAANVPRFREQEQAGGSLPPLPPAAPLQSSHQACKPPYVLGSPSAPGTQIQSPASKLPAFHFQSRSSLLTSYSAKSCSCLFSKACSNKPSRINVSTWRMRYPPSSSLIALPCYELSCFVTRARGSP